jgi:hypothetical protein
MNQGFGQVYYDMDTWDTQLPDDEDRDGSQNIILLTTEPPNTVASLRTFYRFLKICFKNSKLQTILK